MKKSPLDKLILWTLSLLNKWHVSRIEKHGKYLIDNPDNYEVLLPNTILDEKSHYDNPLFVALKTPKVINIAVTGPYGSGKSSFLRTFEMKNAEWKYLPISLATFKDKEEDSENETTEDNSSDSDEKSLFEQHQDIERSILQQFFYRETDSMVPFSRFKRIKNIHKKIIFYHSFIIGFLSIYIFNLYKPEMITKIFSLNPFELDKYHIISYITSLVLFYYLYKIFEYLWNMQISKFNFKKGEITLAKQDKASILNEHLDEILYFFEVTDYNVVVFEDLDRFNNTEIFIKLRELNNLINNSKQIGREVKFIYAIKDDMFIDKERTKFFDFIVPIIPYINPSNSERKLADKFSKEIEDKRISESFISQVSLYIEDMRLLLNIYNEYMIYKNNLDIKNSTFVYNKILALVIYKNFYPLEFTKLHSREGLIYDLFSLKPKYIKESIESHYKIKETLEQKIDKINNEKIENIEELRLVYLAKVFSMTNAQWLSIQGNWQYKKNLTQFNSEESFDNIIHSKTICIGYNQHNNELGRIDFEEVENSLNQKYTYQERKKLIESKFNDELNNLKKELEEIDKKINLLKHATLEELFETVSNLIVSDKYKEQDLLIFLVRNGYIDENYEHYISYFHKGGITQEDREFLLSVQNFKRLDFQFKLGNVKKLIEKLEDNNFHQIEILNIDLLKYLLKNKTEKQYSIQLQTYIKQLSNASELSKKFIFEFLDMAESNYQLALIKNLEWNGLWQYIYTSFSSEKQKEYFKLIFQALDIEKIVALNIDNSLEKYLESQTRLPKLDESKTKKCEELISRLNLKFSNIENPSENSSFFDFIYQNNHYILNGDMISIIMKLKGSTDFDNLKTAYFTTILGSEAKFLITYIDENINEYIEKIFLAEEENTQETEQTVIDLLNNENISFTNKVAIIEKEDVKISDITSIKDTNLWNELVQQNKIIPTWDNLLYFYQEDEELNKTIVDYLNIEGNSAELSKSKINNKNAFDEEKILKAFCRKLLLEDSITIDSYKTIIKSIPYWYRQIDISSLSSEKIDIILENKKLQLTQENFNNLKVNFPSKHIILIENLKDDCLEQINDFELDIDDIILLINSEKFTIDEKFHIIENMDTALFENDKEATETISKLYIENNRKLELELFEKLFYGENDFDLEILISQIVYFDNCEMCKKYLNEFSEPYNELLEEGHGYITLDDTELNRLLLTQLNEKSCIGKFPITKNKIRAYKKDYN